MKRKSKKLNAYCLIAKGGLSIFMAYITIMVSLIDNFERSLGYLCIFTLVYYFLMGDMLFSINSNLSTKIYRVFGGRSKLNFKNIYLKSFLIPSLVLGAASLLSLALIRHYLASAESVIDDSGFFYLMELAQSIPQKILPFVLISILLLFLVQLYFFCKIRIKKTQGLIMAITSTMLTVLLIGGVLLIGVLAYFTIGGLLR